MDTAHPAIDYARIGRAVAHYQAKGYELVSVPWTVEARHAMATLAKPEYLAWRSWRRWNMGEDPSKAAASFDVLVGSAEQSFVQMRIDGQLPSGRYVAVTPCFRNEAADSGRLWQPYFMKVELWDDSVIPMNTILMDEMVDHACEFFDSELRKVGFSEGCEWVRTSEGWDLGFRGVELGSYGLRTLPVSRTGRLSSKLDWAYATGLAEPRFSLATSTSTA